jgi:hypothetical protein
VKVRERLLDRLAVGGSGSSAVELVDRLGGQVLERDPVGVCLRGDRCGR